MTLGLAAVIVFAVASATYVAMRYIGPLVYPLWRARCPSSLRRLAHLPATNRSLYVRYRCGACCRHWVWCETGLVSHEAFTAGAREPFPVATIRRP